jgi:hypothetical protein
MYPIITPNNPVPAGGYLPYFYQSGVFERYGLPAVVRGRTLDPESATSYAFRSDDGFVRTLDRHQTVEQIIASGYFAAPPGDPETAILSDKKATSWLGLDDIISQIRDRYDVYQRNMYELELAKSAATNSLYAHWAYHGLPDAKQFYSRHKRIQELYQEQRDQRVNLWRDVSRLRLGLPESAQSYLSSHRKLQALETITGELP